MRIREIFIRRTVVKKISNKHGVNRDEAAEVFEDGPIFRRAAAGQYAALGYTRKGRLLAVFFTYDAQTKTVWITTAYQASPRQARWYHNTRK